MAASRAGNTFAEPPDPAVVASLDEVAQGLRRLKAWAGEPSYDTITERINARWRRSGRPERELARRATVADCFRAGRRRMNTELVIAIVRSVCPDPAYAGHWHRALQVITGEASAASQVQVGDSLPEDLAAFTGRAAELEMLRRALRDGRSGQAVVISAIAGMAGVGKTQLAVHAGHLLARQGTVDRVLVVNLRGFHPGRAQPPADPGAVLDGFLRLLGVPGGRIPHSLQARTALYRERLAGRRTLILLDNAATVEQVLPLLPATPGCPVLITSRRDLEGLAPGPRLTVDVFTADEAAVFLARTVAAVATGEDPHAAARIARHCGFLPLALGLIAGHIRATEGWTLTDHADRLDERRRTRSLDAGVQLAIDLSYERVPADQQRLLRLTALHPGQDFDAYAAAALTATAVEATGEQLRLLHRDHLVQQSTRGRYTFHDLIRAYAGGRAEDQDAPSARRAALTRLFDYYLATSAAAADVLYPAEAYHRPRVPAPATPGPPLTGPAAAVDWLNAERLTLVAVAGHTAAHGWPGHAIRLSPTLYRHLDGGHSADGRVIHDHAHRAAVQEGDLGGQAHALTGLATVELRRGRLGAATELYRQARDLFEKIGDPAGQARTVGSLGNIEKRLGRFAEALELQLRAREFFRQAGDRAGEARAVRNLGAVEGRMGRYAAAGEHLGQALELARAARDQLAEADALFALGEVAMRQDRLDESADRYGRAIELYRELGDESSELAARDDLGIVLTRLGRPDLAVGHHEAALAFHRRGGLGDGQASVLNGLAEAISAAGRPAAALAHYGEVLAGAAAGTTEPDQLARAHAGLADAHRRLGHPVLAREHYRRAAGLFADLGMPEAAALWDRENRIGTG